VVGLDQKGIIFVLNSMNTSKISNFKFQISKIIEFFRLRVSGFTLIELLVVISIIGILAGIGVGRYSAAEKQARDSQRKSDLNQYRVALENYSSSSNLTYPIRACGQVTNLCNFVIGASNFQTIYLAGSCLVDRRSASSGENYYYCSDGTDYVVWASLESGGSYEACSNGKFGKLTTSVVPADSVCDL